MSNRRAFLAPRFFCCPQICTCTSEFEPGKHQGTYSCCNFPPYWHFQFRWISCRFNQSLLSIFTSVSASPIAFVIFFLFPAKQNFYETLIIFTRTEVYFFSIIVICCYDRIGRWYYCPEATG